MCSNRCFNQGTTTGSRPQETRPSSSNNYVIMALKNFNPNTFLETWSDEKYSPTHSGKTFAQCIRAAFDIPETDKYIYRAQAETTLDITQRAIAAKRTHGMHGWYHDEEGKPVSPTVSIIHPIPPAITCSNNHHLTHLKARSLAPNRLRNNHIHNTLLPHSLPSQSPNQLHLERQIRFPQPSNLASPTLKTPQHNHRPAPLQKIH